MMRKLIAGGILTAMLSGLAWAAKRHISYGERIIKLETKEKTNSELLKEVRDDVKVILERL